MYVLNIYSLKWKVSVRSWFEIYELEKNELFQDYLDQTVAQESSGDCQVCLLNYVFIQYNVWFVKCDSERFRMNFPEKLKFPPLIIAYASKDSAISHDLS